MVDTGSGDRLRGGPDPREAADGSIADPSHGTGIRNKVVPLARAAVAAGGGRCEAEVRYDPEHALSDGTQSLFPQQIDETMEQIGVIPKAIGRERTPALRPVRSTEAVG